ncbi:3,4-dihydroxy-2-butanone-4-phosphate synthase [Stetteria hydrogenophila]
MLLHDDKGREDEVDMVFYAGHVDEWRVYLLRTMAGGLLCYATTQDVARGLGLPYGDELLRLHPGLEAIASRRLRYGDRPAFTVWVNHVSVRTGVSDEDRAKTIRELHAVASMYLDGDVEGARRKFLAEFQAPGHVPILAARSLKERRGHTELATTLAVLAGLKPSVAFAEVLARGRSMSLEEAEKLSDATGWPLVRGEWVVEACRDEGLCGSG